MDTPGNSPAPDTTGYDLSSLLVQLELEAREHLRTAAAHRGAATNNPNQRVRGWEAAQAVLRHAQLEGPLDGLDLKLAMTALDGAGIAARLLAGDTGYNDSLDAAAEMARAAYCRYLEARNASEPTP